MKIYHSIVACLLAIGANAQDYWQQEVNYTIDVKLDDVNHRLSAQESFEYINNSPDALSKIYVHLWPNAYKDGNTALGKQQYEGGDFQLTDGKEEIKGNIDSLNFTVNGNKIEWQYDEENPDIAILTLPNTLLTGDRVTISTPFSVKIPSGSISRLGHIGESYQITQWYVKPAVYDKNGWNPIPYLNQGEFYSEYGSFDVSITLPKNYVVGATGDLQTASEIAFLDSLAEATRASIPEEMSMKPKRSKGGDTYPESSTEYKTIRYTQSNVHDFAWFADKRYKVLKSEVKLPHSGRKVTSWAMYTPKNEYLWKDASEYLNDAIHYYSLWNGDYPYNQVTAVDGTISAGGGMEYPNVTVIGNSGTAQMLEVVIVHEVGHNWFYGQLGSNERVHGWMDEGMNTLNEVRYMQTKYPDNTAMSDMVLNGRFHLNDLSHHDMGDISYRMIAFLGEDQPIETHSARFTSMNYGIIMYQKTGLVFFYLLEYLGEEKFNECMRNYYAEWEFKHPQPEDMRASMEKSTGEDLSWLFEDLINETAHIDFKCGHVKHNKDNSYTAKIKNVGQVNGPSQVDALVGDSVVESVTLKPGFKNEKVTFTNPNIDAIHIDDKKYIPELYRQNNNWKKEGILGRYEKPKVEFFFGDNERNKSNAFWTPMIGYNYYDKFMVGAAFHNAGISLNKFSYLIVPMYSVGREMISGISEFAYMTQPKRGLKTSKFGLSIKSFKQDTTYRGNDSHYIGIAPYWSAKIGNRGDKKNYAQSIRVQTIYKKDKYGPTHVEHAGAFVEYDYTYQRPDHKVNFKLRNDFITNVNTSDQMARLFGEASYEFRYLRKKSKRYMSLRVFAGQTYMREFDPSTGYQYSMSLAGTDGRQDLYLDEYYFGRNGDGIGNYQRQENMGGFKSTSSFGTTAYGMGAANLYVQLPLPTGLLGVFVDAGAFSDGVDIQSAFQTGLALRIKDVFGIYFPIYMSDNLESSFASADYKERIRFTLKFNILNKPINLGLRN